MPRGIPKIPKLKAGEGIADQVEPIEPPAIGLDRTEPRQCPAVGRTVFDMHYNDNGVLRVQSGFLSEQAAWRWLGGIRA